MIKRLMGAMLLLPFMGVAQEAYTLKGKIGNESQPAKMYLYYMDAKGEHHFDSTEMQNGDFAFKGMIDQPRKASMILAHKPVKFKFFMEVMVHVQKEEDFKNGSIDVLSLYLEPGITTLASPDSLFNARVTGSQRNEDLSVLNHAKLPVRDRLKAIVNTINAKGMAGKLSTDEWQRMEEEYKTELLSIKQVDLDFVKQHPASLVSLDVMEQYVDLESATTLMEPLFNKLSATLKRSERGKALQEKISANKLIDLGSIAPSFTLPDTSGHTVSLSDYRGKYVLIDFWASWCSPCRAENPDVVAAFNAYKSKNFTVLGVSLDKTVSKDKWLKAIEDDHIGAWAQVADMAAEKNAAAVKFHVNNIPQNFLLDPQGKIIGRNLHGNTLKAALAAVLK